MCPILQKVQYLFDKSETNQWEDKGVKNKQQTSFGRRKGTENIT